MTYFTNWNRRPKTRRTDHKEAAGASHLHSEVQPLRRQHLGQDERDPPPVLRPREREAAADRCEQEELQAEEE